MAARYYRLRDMKPEDFAIICKRSESIAEIIRTIGFSATSTAYRAIRTRAAKEGVSLDHIPKGLGSRRGKVPVNRATAESVLTSKNRGTIKRVLMREGILVNVCAICACPPVWQESPLVLRLDHINGDKTDNSLSNLRLVCPNCDSQLPTFSGRNRTTVKHVCADCDRRTWRGSTRCRKCNHRNRIGTVPTKIKWPDDETLLALIRKSNKNQVALTLGVSWNGLEHRLKVRELWHLVRER